MGVLAVEFRFWTLMRKHNIDIRGMSVDGLANACLRIEDWQDQVEAKQLLTLLVKAGALG